MRTAINAPARPILGTKSPLVIRSALVGIPLLGLLAVAAIVGTTIPRAATVVRPPRLPVDSARIERTLVSSERVSFEGIDGITLVGDYVAPRNGAMIVLVHGLYANREELLPDARLLADSGYGVLIYDNRAHGDSGGSIATWGQLESGDVARAVDFVQQKSGLPRSKIGLVGLSIGGTAVLREATADTEVGAIVVEATYSSMVGELEFMYSKYGLLSELTARWTAQLLGHLDYAQIEPQNLVCGLQSRPLLLVYGSRDSDVPLEEGYRMAAAACRSDALVVVNTDTHGRFMESADTDSYARRLVAFLDASLLGRG
jgi:dipeptidyl aminopeptidase/acylaminoacyl peptidase